VSKYIQAMHSGATTVMRPNISTEVLPSLEDTHEPGPGWSTPAVALVEPGDLIGDLARDPALRRLSEQLAALGSGENPVRLLVSGCRPGDGASTIAAAIALDLSQRLAMRTLLVDGHLRHPALRSLLARSTPQPPDLASAASIGSQRTAWPRLELISRTPADLSRPMLEDLGGLMRRFPIAVIDLGVIRLEPRMLALARPSDPVLIVTRYQHTERQELLTTAGVLRATNHTLSGVILNAYKSPVPDIIRRYLGFGG
jgi:polysaccharide biosynthesis transport protein